MAKFFVTTPIYYVNAKPHIGHIYSTIAADVLARFHKSQGQEILFSTGVDENSQKNVEAAKKEGQDVQAYVDAMAQVWENTFTQLNFTYTNFVRTTSAEHAEAVMEIISRLHKHDDIYLGDYVGFYCVGCEEFIPEKDLVDGKCAIHKTEPQKISEKNYFFRLTKYRDQLLGYYREHPEFVQPESARNKMLYYIENELQDISISRQAQEWGIRLPNDPTHAVYVWFDALINYLTVTGFPKEGYDKWWPVDVHVIGKDIIKFHCAIWPAMLLAAGLELPKKIFAHGFFTINGEKISKSLGNAIDPHDLLKEYPLDAIRYYLLREIPFGSDGDFSVERLKERYNADLANGLGNLVSRTLNMIEKFWPDFSGDAQELPQEVQAKIVGVNAHIENLHFDRALATINEVISWADTTIEENRPWEKIEQDKEGTLTILSQLYATLKAVNDKLEALLPDTHKKLTTLLEARPIKKPAEPLFARK